ncbi:MAG: zf-HC2 domain-containing protein [Cellulomonadaceae bacterium]
MNHFGPWITAYVDGQLSAAQAERLVAHVAVCADCARALAEERHARSALACTAVDVVPSAELTARLLGMAAAGHVPRLKDPPVPLATGGARSPVHEALTGEVGGRPQRRRVLRRAATGALTTACIGVTALALLGRLDIVTVTADTGEDLTVLGAVPAPRQGARLVTASSTSAAPAAGPLRREALAADGWHAPAQIPADWTVTAVRSDEDMLEIDLEVAGTTVVIRERAGLLDADALAGVPWQTLGEREVAVLSTSPWHVVWQADDVVIDVLSHGEQAAAEVVAALPGAPYDDGVLRRVARGWERAFDVVAR